MARLRNVAGVLALSLCLISRVMAAKNTSPVEAVFLWYAYRMDIEAFGNREEGIAYRCSGKSFSDGTCKFDEFIRYIHKGKNAIDPNLETSIGESLWPDADTAANEVGKLKQIGGAPYAAHDSVKLFKNGESITDLAGILKKATEMIQKARSELGDGNDKIKPGLEQARNAMGKAQQMRLEETARDDELVKALETFKQEKGRSFPVVSKPFILPDGKPGKLLDMDEMYKQSTWSTDWKDYQTWIQEKAGRKNPQYLRSARMHTNALVATQGMSSRLQGPPPC